MIDDPLKRRPIETSKKGKMTLSDIEQFWIGIARLNKLYKPISIEKNWKVGRLSIGFEWRSKKNLWGRFGGGWNWAVGFEAGGRTLLVRLLICTLKFKWIKDLSGYE